MTLWLEDLAPYAIIALVILLSAPPFLAHFWSLRRSSRVRPCRPNLRSPGSDRP
jgi:hypothetical protein